MRIACLVLVSVSSVLGVTTESASLSAQALPTAQKAAEITAFGGYTPSSPDFGPRTYNGFTAGADFTIFPPLRFDPSVEVRFTRSHSYDMTEKSFLVGPRLQKDFGRDHYHPYIDFLVGRGSFNYSGVVPVGFSNTASGFALSYGGGIDIDVTHHVSLKLDLQQQSWSMGTNRFFKPNGETFTLAPRTYTVGATYHFQFPGLNKQRELR
jgi:opacity protein-like surface antigen